jgi:CubicO group peptidase (beta-lactamase class C family)
MRLALHFVILCLALTAHADIAASLDDYFSRAAAHGFSGSALVARGNKVLLRKGYGLAGRRERVDATPATAYNIASLDKQFIAAAILRLEELGKLNTSDPLTRFFDFVPDEKKTLTIHQLLSHTSGLRNEYWDEHPELSRERFVHFVLAEQPLESSPGSAWSYSNSGFIVLERVIEIASGRSYEQFLHDELFAPAGMANTGFALPRWNPRQVAHYDFWTVDSASLKGDASYDDPLRRPPPFGVLLSTVDDLWKWRRALPRVLSPASRAKLWKPVMNGYAYGWNIVVTTRGTRLVHHGGSDSTAGMLVTYRDYIDDDVFFVVATNSMQPGLVSDYLAADVEALLFGGCATLPPPSVPNRDTVAGKYGAYEIVAIKGGPLVLFTEDRSAMIALRFPSAAPLQDETANELVRATLAGDFAPLRAATHAGEDFVKRTQEAIAEWTKEYGKPTGVKTIGQRAFVFESEPELQSYVRVDFERGVEVLRVLHSGSGLLELGRLTMPPRIEMVLAPAGPGRWTTWDFKLGMGAIVGREHGRLVLRGQ